MRADTQHWLELDFRHCWHPFTRQQEWCDPCSPPLVITHGKGSRLWDSEGRSYLDGNSSIWTNIHGHCHPHISAAIERQLHQVAHASFLGFTHPGAVQLASRLCAHFPTDTLTRVFFSDDGSTALECALKMAVQFRLQCGASHRSRFIAFANGYHGDTLGAASLGGVSRFFERFRNTGYPVHHVASLEALLALPDDTVRETAAVVIEPLIQGVNEMRPWPPGMLTTLRQWCTEHDIHLVLDEVMTGFGRTGKMFACLHEAVTPDFLCVAKGLTGGYLPLAATLTTEAVYQAFLGPAEHAFYYGHSYTANPLGCAAALASLEVFDSENTLTKLQPKIASLTTGLELLKKHHDVIHEVRQVGFIAGIELRQPDGTRFPSEHRTGERFCLLARKHGLLTRPILDTIVLMLPLSTDPAEIDFALAAIDATCGEFGN